jgi:1-acyl-sn-glycerol-3-phosphate acyltransferase
VGDPIRLILLALYTVVIGIPVIAVSPFDREARAVRALGRTWIRWILGTFRIRVLVEGLENVPLRAPVIFMSNHQSQVDIAAIIDSLPPPVSWRFVAKKELVRVPVFGWCLVTTGQIIIDRGDREKAVASLRHAAERIRNGASVIVFPEGTRSPTGSLRPFKSGPFHLAVEAQVPIIPVTVSGSQRITPKGRLEVHPGQVKIVFGKPIPTRGVRLEERAQLKTRVREAIAQGYDVAFQGTPVIEPAPDDDEATAAAVADPRRAGEHV